MSIYITLNRGGCKVKIPDLEFHIGVYIYIILNRGGCKVKIPDVEFHIGIYIYTSPWIEMVTLKPSLLTA